MLRILLLRFWPALLPLLAYAVWLWYLRRKLRRGELAREDLPPNLVRGPLFWALLSSLAILAACFLAYGLSIKPTGDSRYAPPRYEDGTLVPGHLEPDTQP